MAAAIPAVSFTPVTGESLTNGPYTLGWEFSLSSAGTVTALGAFNSTGTGLAESHDVGIWDSTGTLLVSATVAAGTVDPLIGQFRYASVSTITLGPGTYEIGALWLDGADNNTFPGDVATVNTIPSLTFIQNSFVAGGTLADPTNTTGSNDSYFGPNFLVGTRSVTPEPGTLVLLGSGLLGAVGVIRRKFTL